MAKQLTLTETANPPARAWQLDERTRERGKRGVASARAALAARADLADLAARADLAALARKQILELMVEGLRQAILIGPHEGFDIMIDLQARHQALRELVKA